MVHSPAAEVVHRSLVEEENHSEFRDLVVDCRNSHNYFAVNRRGSHNYLAVDHRDFRSYLVAVPVLQNRSSPA